MPICLELLKFMSIENHNEMNVMLLIEKQSLIKHPINIIIHLGAMFTEISKQVRPGM